MLVPALISAAVAFPAIATAGNTHLAARAAGICAALVLGVAWARGYRRGGFGPRSEVVEALAMAVVLAVAPGQPPLPLFGTTYRSLYGRLRVALVRVGVWIVAIALIAVRDGRFELDDQLGKAGGLLLATAVMQMLARSLHDLQRSERRVRAMLEHSTDVVTIVEDDLRIRWQAPSIRRVLGRDPDEMIGRLLDELVHPDEAAAVRHALTADVPPPGQTATLSFQMRDAGGAYREIEAIVGNRIADEHIGGLLLTLRDVTERRILERDRVELEWLAERVEAQRQRQALEARLQRSLRLESVGQLAGGVAHDFNNLLAAILNYAEILRDDVAEIPLAIESVDEIQDAATRGARLVRQLLQFTKGQLTEPQPVSLNTTISSLSGLLSGSIPSHVELSYDLDEQLPDIEADLTNVEQIIVNLVLNARDALDPHGGAIQVSTASVHVPAGEAVDLDVSTGPYVRLTVADDGCGMDPATLERVLEPFFTTKSLGEGTGLGLSTVHGIVTGTGGYLAIDSTPCIGTTVDVHLPAHPHAQPA